MKSITVIKIGGSTFGGRDTTTEDIVSLQSQGEALVVVHGGGGTVTEWLKRQGVSTRFVHGERVTDATILEVVTAVLAGLVNKEIVAAINSLGGRAVGISGVDGALVEGKMKGQEMGYVGTVEKVNPAPLEALLKAGFIPVVSPVSLHSIDRPDNAPQIINLNSDPVAGDIAAALGAERLILLTNVAGISDESGRIIPRMSAGEAEALVASGVISGGMIPKINACLRALTAVSAARIIDGRQPHALVKEMKGQEGGTTIYKS
jgi:acetylglutamate kinase